MTPFTRMIRWIPDRAHPLISAWLVAVAAVALVWIGQASADKGGPSSAAISTEVSDVATGKADAADATNEVCADSHEFADMPGMTRAFKLRGTAPQPVIVFFQGQWSRIPAALSVIVRLTIDGFPQGSDLIVAGRAQFEPDVSAAHGFNFISSALTPGLHAAVIQWRLNGFGSVEGGCVTNRTMGVLHK